jgi:NAD(P)-dependent dehydrogenase (short-subunit alcohol dehydrogenase family)
MLKFDYSNKVALVTGSSRGIGYATARMLLDSGARVMINGVDETRLENALKSLSKYGENVTAHRADIRIRVEVEEMFQALIDHWGRIDILVNNAADRPVAKVVDMTEEEFDRNIDSTLKGTFNCSQLASQQMIKQGWGGKIVNVASGSWKVAREAAAAYCASKAGMVMFANCLALELGPHKINVNSVAPGLIDVGEELTPAKVAYDKATINMTPWGRIGKPEDIANAILMLCSPQADFMTGVVVSVDGGLSVGRYGIPVSPY